MAKELLGFLGALEQLAEIESQLQAVTHIGIVEVEVEAFAQFVEAVDDGVAVDREGSVYIAGTTNSTDFPTTEHSPSAISGSPKIAFQPCAL